MPPVLESLLSKELMSTGKKLHAREVFKIFKR
jgi:hypothetical protein